MTALTTSRQRKALLVLQACLLLLHLTGVGLAQSDGTGTSAAMQDGGALAKGSTGTPVADPNLTIGPGDLLSVTVFDTPEMSGKFRVEESGNISLPLLGVMHVGGLSIFEFEHKVRAELIGRRLIRDPQVSAQVMEFGRQGVTVTGEVVRPGIFPILGGKRLFDVLALSGGVSPAAGGKAVIMRREPGHETNVVFRNSNGLIPAGNVPLYPGDTVLVQRAGIVYVLGDVTKPGGYIIERQTFSVLQALSAAQGTTKTSSLGAARVLRKTSDTEAYQDIAIDIRPLLKGQRPDMQLQDGDVLYVPISHWKDFYENSTQGILSTLASATIYSIPKN